MCIIILLIFILSIGFASAQDLNDTDETAIGDTNEIAVDNLGESGVKTFKDLSDVLLNISDTPTEVNLTDDYVYDEEIDNENNTFLIINGNNVTVNGNGHTLDAKDGFSGFSLYSANVTFNDLILVNCDLFWITGTSSNVVLNNITFIDDASDSEIRTFIVMRDNSNATIKSCSFYSTTEHDGDIYVLSSDNVVIEDCIFSGGGVTFGNVLTPYGCNLYVNNSTFINSRSKYATAIYCEGLQCVIMNSRFINLTSNLTAGAIGIKLPYEGNLNQTPKYLIENCAFENTSSSKNAGALFFDSLGMTGLGQKFKNITLDIINSTFKNCSSNFGGAVMQLWGNLNITDSTFINNYAITSGGAIYTSCSNLSIVNSKLIDNVGDFQAGAIFFDEGILTISDSQLIGNKVTYSVIKNTANTIYTYNANVTFADSLFNNSGISVFGVFSNFTETNMTYVNDELSRDNVEYETFIASYSMPLEFIDNTIDVTTLPSRFDLRDWGWAGIVYNQGYNGACWAFGSIGAIESALLKATGIQYMFSPNNMQNMELMYSKYGNKLMMEGGAIPSAPGYLLSWLGIHSSESDPYDELGKISELIYIDDCNLQIQDVIFIPGGSNTTMINLKEALIKYGGLAISYGSHGDEEPYYNQETAACYYNESKSSNHMVTLVGWDDNYSKDNFLITPPGDGAWICKNSWGTDFGENGYFYLSYYDKSFLYDNTTSWIYSSAVGYIFDNTIDYNINYQTDLAGLGYFDGNYTYYSNEFISQASELLGAVGTYFNESGIDYELKVYVNDKLMHTQTGVSEFAGFRTIVLNKYVPVIAGDKIKVVFKSNAVPFAVQTRMHLIEKMSFVSSDGKTWIDALDMNTTVCLKAYTVDDSSIIINNKDISVDYDGGKYFSVKVVTAYGVPVAAGESVKFTINGKTTIVKTDANGIAKIKITGLPKKYTITTTIPNSDYSVKNTVTVKQVLKASKVTVKKKTAKKFTLKATLKINGKLVKGKKITFKFKGKTYKVKTNSKGVAQKTLNKKVIKKLKKGKKYTVKVTYLKDTIKTTVRVK